MRNEKKTKCKSMKDYSKAENESEEVGQHVWLNSQIHPQHLV